MPRRSDTTDLLADLQAQGFEVCLVKNGHWQVTAPKKLGGRKCQIANSPRYQRQVLNAVTRLKRIGYEPPKKNQKKKSGQKSLQNRT